MPVCRARSLVAAALLALALAGCGSGGSSTQSSTTGGSSASGTATGAPVPSTASTPTTAASGPSRTITAPAAAPQPVTGSTGIDPALAVLASRGYTVVSRDVWEPEHTLSVLVGQRTGAGQLAFFFVGHRYIGTDASAPSRQIQVLHQQDTTITLGYGNSQGGQAIVPFHWNGSRLAPQAPIPPASQRG
jgi:hypothetical protein